MPARLQPDRRGTPSEIPRAYPQAPLLSRSELEALLGFMGRDSSALGRRDYAFMLARLRLGVPLQRLQRLRWEQMSR